MPALLLCSAVALLAQPATFEVATLKHTEPREDSGARVGWSGGPGTSDPERFTAENVALGRLISRAYDLKPYQLSAPASVTVERYTINAKVALGVTEPQFRLMLQNLLAERLALRVHWETKELPAYDLVTAKSGPKFKEGTPPPPVRLPEGYPVLSPGDGPEAITQRGRSVFRAHRQGTDELADSLSIYLRRPVMDRTGLESKYDFTFYWVQNPDVLPPGAETGPTLFEALQEQLGLKVSSKQATVRILVVDHAEKFPVGN